MYKGYLERNWEAWFYNNTFAPGRIVEAKKLDTELASQAQPSL